MVELTIGFDKGFLLLIFCIFGADFAICQPNRTLSFEEQCTEAVMNRYRNILARPVANSSDYMHMNASMSIFNLLRVDNQQQTIKVAAFLTLTWEDDSVKWNENDFGGIKTIQLTSSQVWLPDLYNTNSVTGKMDKSIGSHRLQINSNGLVQWWPVDLFEVSCQLDMKYFPFDTQKCQLEFESWSYSYEQLRFISSSEEITLSNMKPSGEWDIVASTAKALLKNYQGDFKWSEMVFTLKITRKSAYYVTNIILPVVAMSLLVLMVFYLPAESGEKISLGITVLLAFSVFQLLMADLMPKTSTVTPILVIYVSLLMGMAIVSTIVAVLVLNVHHQHDKGTSIPEWARTLVYKYLAPMVCAKKLVKPFLQGSKNDAKVSPQTHVSKNTNHVENANDLNLHDLETLQSETKHDLTMRKFSVFLTDQQGHVMTRNDFELRAIEWRLMARVLDRFLMFVYFFVNILMAIVCLSAATNPA